MQTLIQRQALWRLPVLGLLLLFTFFAVNTRASAETLLIGTTTLPAAEVSVTYSSILTASGGTAPYTWSITSGSLPAGLTLNPATATISGTSTVAGTSNFTAQVTDSTSTTATQVLSIIVHAAVDVSTTSLPTGQVGNAYSQTLAAAGGVAPYAWSTTAGSLPAGLTLNASTGAVTGIPTTTGTSNFTVQVTDALSATATEALSIAVNNDLTLVTTSLPDGQVGVAYSQTLTATGGATPHTWSITSGSLPAGLTLNASAGVLSGTPTAAGTANFSMQVTDSAAHSVARAFSITVSAGTLTVTTSSLPSGKVDVAYSKMLTATGGTTPYVWSITAGGLPAGLALNASTGVISGTPTATGSSAFTVQVADSASHTATKALSITVKLHDAGDDDDDRHHGLCNALFRGSERGREQKSKATAFQRLIDAAQAAGINIEQFCDRDDDDDDDDRHELRRDISGNDHQDKDKDKDKIKVKGKKVGD